MKKMNRPRPREFYTSEISWTEEDKYHVILLVCGIYRPTTTTTK